MIRLFFIKHNVDFPPLHFRLESFWQFLCFFPQRKLSTITAIMVDFWGRLSFISLENASVKITTFEKPQNTEYSSVIISFLCEIVGPENEPQSTNVFFSKWDALFLILGPPYTIWKSPKRSHLRLLCLQMLENETFWQFSNSVIRVTRFSRTKERAADLPPFAIQSWMAIEQKNC